MDSLKKLQIPARVHINSGNSTKKENTSGSTTISKQKKSLNLHLTTARMTSRNLKIPREHGILSDSTLLLPEKKVKIMSQSKVDRNCTASRIPLENLDKNITNISHLKYSKLTPRSNISSHLRQPVLTESDTPSDNMKWKVCAIDQLGKEHKQNITVPKNLASFSKADIEYQPDLDGTFAKSSKYISYKPHLKMQKNNCIQMSVSRSVSIYQPNMPNYGQKVNTPKTDRPLKFCRNQTPHPETSILQNNHILNELFIDSCIEPIFPKSLERKYLQTESAHVNLNTRYMSPITAHTSLPKATVIFQGIPKGFKRPAKKTTLPHKMHSRHKQAYYEAYCLDIYNAEYLEDILYHQLENDWKYTVKINKLQLYVRNRAAVVNWLIQAQDYLTLPSQVLFTTIRLFDKVLENTLVSCNMCQLVGLVIMWIMNKFENNTDLLTASKILVLCNGAYSVQDILSMERKLLKFFNFDLNISDIATYIAFYFKKLNIESDLLLHCTLYILECYTLNLKFSTIIPSIQAAAAVRLSISILQPFSTAWQQLETTSCYYREDELEDTVQEMLQQLHRIQDPAYEYRQPYHKYAENDKVQASIVLLRKLVAT